MNTSSPHGLSEILDRVSDAVFAVDAHWGITFVNASAAELGTKSAPELVGCVLWDEFPGLRGTAFENRARRSLATGLESKSADFFPAYGFWADVSIHPSRAGLTIYLQDCTARRKAEESHRFQSAALRAVGEAVIATDLEGRVTFWNEAAEDLYGWTSAEAVGMSIIELTPSEMSRAQADEIMARLRQGERWQGEFEVRRKDGSSFLAHVTDAPILDDGGRLSGIVGISYRLGVPAGAESHGAAETGALSASTSQE